MKKSLVIIVIAAIMIAGGAVGYHFGSPKVIVENLSNAPIQEVVVELPASRISFAKIAPGSTSTIYFMPQDRGGNIQYSVRVGGVVLTGTQPYTVSGQIGRKIQIRINPDGSISVDQ